MFNRLRAGAAYTATQPVCRPAAPTSQTEYVARLSRVGLAIREYKLMTMEKVAAAAPVAPWLGGKKLLHEKIIARIDRIKHSAYVEPFVGMGGVFLRRSWRPKVEVINDLNGEITNLFRILQRHYPQFLDMLRFQVVSRREFERLRNASPESLTDLERAARFIYLQRLAFGGRVGGVMGVSLTQPRFSLAKLEPLLDAAHSRLDGVVFENLDWHEVVRRYDSKDTLFYLDPPYMGGEKDYGKELFDRSQYETMADALSKIDGAFILSINDREEIRNLFSSFNIESVSLNYSISMNKSTQAQELFISNRDVSPTLV